MHLLLSSGGRIAAVVAALAASSSFLTGQCPDANIGPNLNLTDDSLSPRQMLGFNFPFAGANYNSVYVASNGFVYLFNTAGTLQPPTSSMCCDADVNLLLGSAHPMVCGQWMDLNPSAGGTVHFNALPGKAVITWQGVPEYAANNTSSFQIVLYPAGNMEMHFGSCTNSGHLALTGWSPGNNAADPGGSDISNRPQVLNSTTVYELFNYNGFDLSDNSMHAVPAGATWQISTPSNCATARRYGQGCPKPCAFYEMFPQPNFDLSTNSLQFIATGNGGYVVIPCAANCFDTNFTNNLNLTDDSLALNQALGFSFPFCGGTTTAIDVCSNGFVWLVAGNNNNGGADYVPTVDALMNEPPRLCPLWMDLNPSGGGGVFFDVFTGKAVVTWNQVPAYGVAGSSNTMQLQLFANGDMILAWPSVTNNATTNSEALAGFSPGNGFPDPGGIDLSATPYTTGNGIPLQLRAQGPSRPVVGGTFTLEMSNVRPGSIAGLFSLGLTDPNLDLTPLGLSGCTLLTSLNVLLSFAPTAPISTLALTIPNDQSLIGGVLLSQTIMIDLSIGAVPAYLSNGLRLTLGL